MLYDKLQLNNIIPLTFLWKLGFEATNYEVERTGFLREWLQMIVCPNMT